MPVPKHQFPGAIRLLFPRKKGPGREETGKVCLEVASGMMKTEKLESREDQTQEWGVRRGN